MYIRNRCHHPQSASFDKIERHEQVTESKHAYLALISHKMRTQLPNNTGDKRGAYLEGTGGEGENRDLTIASLPPSGDAEAASGAKAAN